ncbi:MAG: hypothetical protein JNG86_02225 [Verrucomicrobiaceae bacterium]|nr:hypothetical protein [Verrucomicrobiaceae bacterium]
MPSKAPASFLRHLKDLPATFFVEMIHQDVVVVQPVADVARAANNMEAPGAIRPAGDRARSWIWGKSRKRLTVKLLLIEGQVYEGNTSSRCSKNLRG